MRLLFLKNLLPLDGNNESLIMIEEGIKNRLIINTLAQIEQFLENEYKPNYITQQKYEQISNDIETSNPEPDINKDSTTNIIWRIVIILVTLALIVLLDFFDFFG